MLQLICELHSIETALLIYRDNCDTPTCDKLNRLVAFSPTRSSCWKKNCLNRTTLQLDYLPGFSARFFIPTSQTWTLLDFVSSLAHWTFYPQMLTLLLLKHTSSRLCQQSKGCLIDKDRNGQGTTAKLVDAGFLVSDKFRGKNMFDFFF